MERGEGGAGRRGSAGDRQNKHKKREEVRESGIQS